jgi:uncharacterized protein YbjT (DUF2867 family)
MHILVTGATGFVGSQLLPRLTSDGHPTRALARNPDRVASHVPVIRGDAFTGEGLARALRGIDVAYYLIHSMERSSAEQGSFEERDRIAAERFAAAAANAGVTRIVYLGGLQPRRGESRGGTATAGAQSLLSRHLASREGVERILLDAVPDSVALRASIVIGARSRSFRLLVHLVERLRVLTLPAWRRYRTQPIDERDVMDMLVACATAPVAGRSLDVGGPDVLTYEEMIDRIADSMLVRRPTVGLGVNLTPLTARVVAAIVKEDPELVVPLMESLEGDLLPADHRAAELLSVELHSFDSAVEHALREWEESEPLAAR